MNSITTLSLRVIISRAMKRARNLARMREIDEQNILVWKHVSVWSGLWFRIGPSGRPLRTQ
jgi:hypothetical protein